MNYQLQPGLINIDEQTTPSSSATDSFVIPPQPSNLNLCCRPNTELYVQLLIKLVKELRIILLN
jgi:hypothetical protein